MDNITLSKEQLYRLISFIEKRGFQTPLVIVEILDHFACKVEEKMKSNPKLSLDEAMENAHADFGVLGFSPVVKAFEAGVKKKYKAVYRKERRKVLANPLYMVVALLAAFIFHRGFNWAEINGYRHVFGLNDVSLILYLSVLSFCGFFLLRFKQMRKNNPIINAIIYRDSWVFFIIVSITCQPEPPHNLRGLMFLSITGTIAVFYYVICLFTTYATMNKGYKDSSIYYDYLKTIQE